MGLRWHLAAACSAANTVRYATLNVLEAILQSKPMVGARIRPAAEIGNSTQLIYVIDNHILLLACYTTMLPIVVFSVAEETFARHLVQSKYIDAN